MNNKELEILKDKYAMGTLTEAEHASIQVEMIQNPDLENELNLHTNMVKGVEYAGEIELKEMLDKIHYQQTDSKSGLSKENQNNKSNHILFVIAGLITLAALIGYFFLGSTTNEPVSPTKIYADFYTPYQPSLQGRGVKLDEAITSFHTAYQDKKYSEAVNIIKPFLDESKNDIKLTAAIAANEANDIVLAEKLLEEIIESDDFYFTDHATWYKALIQLKTNNLDVIEKILTPLIANPKADHHTEAKELIAKIRG